MLHYGDSDIGKTMIVDKFVRDDPNICNQFGEVEARKVFRLQVTGMITTLLAQAAELAIRQKTQSISLDLLMDAATAGIFKLPAEQEIAAALA